MKVLITGAGGFLGTAMTKFLSECDCEIFNLGSRAIENSKYFPLHNILDFDSIKKSLLEIRPDFLIHLAGSNITDSLLDSFRVNAFFSAQLLNVLTDLQLINHTKILLTGSSAEYGPIEEDSLPIKETMLAKPNTIYGRSKLMQTEIALSTLFNDSQITVVRPFNVIGPNCPDHLAFGNFLNQIKHAKESGTLKTGNLESYRDFIDLEDVINLIWKLINNKKAYGKIVNICSGNPVSMKNLVNDLIEISNKNIEVVHENNRLRANDIRVHYGDNSRLVQIVGDYDFIPMKESIQRIMKGA